MQYTKEPAFINRQKEISYLQQCLQECPEKLLFIYGPKSSGKTTVLIHLIDQVLDPKQYEIKTLNLRQTLITSYRDFLQTMFGPDYSRKGEKEEKKKKREFNLKIFKQSTETLKAIQTLELDPFSVMKVELTKLKEKKKTPIIIVDELQALEGIYMNGQRELIKELFNFFVSLTKELHLCHVIISTSDGHFMSRIYNDSKLRKTSGFFKIDYLSQEDVFFWLNHLEQESKITNMCLTEKQVQTIWEHLGGSPAEISHLLGDLLQTAKKGKVEDSALDQLLSVIEITSRSLWASYAELYPTKQKLLQEIHRALQTKDFFIQKDLINLIQEELFEAPALIEELGKLVGQNFIAFDPVTGEYTLQGKSVEKGLHSFIQSLEK